MAKRQLVQRLAVAMLLCLVTWHITCQPVQASTAHVPRESLVVLAIFSAIDTIGMTAMLLGGVGYNGNVCHVGNILGKGSNIAVLLALLFDCIYILTAPSPSESAFLVLGPLSLVNALMAFRASAEFFRDAGAIYWQRAGRIYPAAGIDARYGEDIVQVADDPEQPDMFVDKVAEESQLFLPDQRAGMLAFALSIGASCCGCCVKVPEEDLKHTLHKAIEDDVVKADFYSRPEVVALIKEIGNISKIQKSGNFFAVRWNWLVQHHSSLGSNLRHLQERLKNDYDLTLISYTDAELANQIREANRIRDAKCCCDRLFDGCCCDVNRGRAARVLYENVADRFACSRLFFGPLFYVVSAMICGLGINSTLTSLESLGVKVIN